MTPEPNENPYAEYEAKLEEHEFLKREGISAWADMMLEMVGDKGKLDPAKAQLIKEGIVNMMAGPPKFPMPTGVAIPIEMPPRPPSAYFREEHDGTVTLWDWRPIAGNATHSERLPSGDVVLWNYREELIRLTGESAAKYWEWQEAIAAVPFSWGPGR